MNSKDKMKIWLLVILVVFSIVSGIGIYRNVKQYDKLSKDTNKLQSVLKKAEKDLSEHEEETMLSAYEAAIDSEDAIVKSVGEHHGENKLAETVAETFFEAFYTWDSGDEYRSRAAGIIDLLTTEMIDDKTLFDDGKDTTGGDYIDTTGIKSRYKSSKVYVENAEDNKIQMLVEVTFENWYRNNEKQSGSKVKFFELKYDRNQRKIESTKAVYPLKK